MYSLSDVSGSSAIVAAVLWLQQTMLGTVATAVAVTAVAWVGMLMLAGRLEIRRGLTVVLGCFVLFGASAIVGGLQSAISDDRTELVSMPPPPPVPQAPPPPARSADPYAGASVPAR
jgi:type IV secretory pathway VirB2 component (pilin)